jgi:hypothetical protein
MVISFAFLLVSYCHAINNPLHLSTETNLSGKHAMKKIMNWSGYQVVFYAVVLLITCGANYVSAQSAPLLTITSPASGTVVAPGETITVIVQSASGVSFRNIGIVGPEGLGIAEGGPSLYQASVTIRSDALPGPTRIAAQGTLSTGGEASSPSVHLIIDNGVAVSSIKALPFSSYNFSKINGGKLYVDVEATYIDGTSASISKAATYTSDNVDVATASEGNIIPTGSGTTTIHVTYKDQTVNLPVTVDQHATGDLDGNGRVDKDDLSIITQSLNTPALGKNDPRDLNHDGKIDALDARILTTLCTYPRCATHP